MPSSTKSDVMLRAYGKRLQPLPSAIPKCVAAITRVIFYSCSPHFSFVYCTYDLVVYTSNYPIVVVISISFITGHEHPLPRWMLEIKFITRKKGVIKALKGIDTFWIFEPFDCFIPIISRRFWDIAEFRSKLFIVIKFFGVYHSESSFIIYSSPKVLKSQAALEYTLILRTPRPFSWLKRSFGKAAIRNLLYRSTILFS